jgi:hypothetical protein
MFELPKDAITFQIRAGVVPRHGLDWRLVQRLVIGHVWAVRIAFRELAVRFNVQLFDTPKAAKLSFIPVEIAVMI